MLQLRHRFIRPIISQRFRQFYFYIFLLYFILCHIVFYYVPRGYLKQYNSDGYITQQNVGMEKLFAITNSCLLTIKKNSPTFWSYTQAPNQLRCLLIACRRRFFFNESFQGCNPRENRWPIPVLNKIYYFL